MRNNKKQLIVIMGIGIVVFAAAFAGISLTKNMGKCCGIDLPWHFHFTRRSNNGKVWHHSKTL